MSSGPPVIGQRSYNYVVLNSTPAVDLEAIFGRLEARVLTAMWDLDSPVTVRDLQPLFRTTAYTTLMTTLDRLYRKGALDREKTGRAFSYRQRWSQADLIARIAGERIGALIGPDPRLQPLVSFFVDAVTRRDAEVLDELERLIARRRAGDQP
jgi:predicted transcriptional regulator